MDLGSLTWDEADGDDKDMVRLGYCFMVFILQGNAECP